MVKIQLQRVTFDFCLSCFRAFVHQPPNQFFTILSQNCLYDKIVERLLSVQSMGSIVVECVAKPMKNDVLSKFRQHLGEECAEMCLRAGMNLRGQKIKKTHTTCK